MMKYFFTLCVVLFMGLPSVFAQNGTSIFYPIEIPVKSCGHTTYSDYKYNGFGSGFVNNYGYESPDIWYRFTLSNSTNVSVSLCGSDFDTNLYILDEYRNLVASNNDNGPLCSGSKSSINQHLYSGTYYVVVEGYYSAVGNIVLDLDIPESGDQIAGSAMKYAIDAGSFGNSGSYTDTRSNADPCLDNRIGQQSNEIYYRFTLGKPSNVKITNCGSNIDTYVHLMNVAGVLIASDGDNYETTPCPGKAYLQTTLSAGTYYLASEGYGSYTGDIATNIDITEIQTVPDLPAISYSTAPVFFVGTAITPLIPTNTGGAVSLINQNTTTFAGSGSLGSSDGVGTSASFSYPIATAVDRAGNIYVADAVSHRIRKISPEGVVSTLAGSSRGYADGIGISARFEYPSSIAVDAFGNVFVSDQSNRRIRKINPKGTVTTFAGSGAAGSANGNGTSASFNRPSGLAFDASGNLYVADDKIRKISPAGVVTTFAGTGSLGDTDGPALSATFRSPNVMAFDKLGNLFISDLGNFSIRKISVAGIVTTLCGGGLPGFSNGTAAASRFNSISGIGVDISGTVYVADQLNNMIRRIDSLGNSSTLAGAIGSGSADGTVGDNVRFDSPYGLSIASNGAIYLSESGGNRIRKVMLIKGYSINPTLPEGLVFNEIDGSISGTPLRSSEATVYTVTAYNSAGSGNATLNLKVIGFCPEPSKNQNYVITYTSRVPQLTTNEAVVSASCNTERVQTSIQYFDGLGRPLQSVQIKGSAAADKDIVSPVAYDTLGRESKKYLPYASTTSNGSYKADALTKVIGYYEGKPDGQESAFSTPYSETRFEISPLNRVLEQGAPGSTWQLAANNTLGHTVKIAYATNIADDVKVWIPGPSGAVAGYYEANKLHKKTVKDENWLASDGRAGTIDEYKDLQGQVVLKRSWETNTKSLDTYYAYDDFGNLRYVLPPAVNKNSDRIDNPINGFTEDDPIFKNFIYGYHYDDSNRMIEKYIPGKDWEYLIYNSLDQVILTQDVIQRNGGQWMFRKFDALGRTIISGLFNDNRVRSVIQNAVDSLVINNPDYAWFESKSTSDIGYTNAVFPTAIANYHIINYYDNYSFPGNLFGQPTTELGQVGPLQTRGLQTGSRVAVLGTGIMLLSVNYYDKKGRVIQHKSQHYKNDVADANNYDEVSNVYSFTDELKESTRKHFNGGTERLYVYNKYQYDHVGRKVATQQKTGDNSATGNALITLSGNVFSEIGQLKARNLHNGLQSTKIYYNERGWLSRIESHEFSYKLDYNNGTNPQYNGNIANQSWGIGSTYPNLFTYSYDKLNRLERGVSASMSELLSYDVMGNIKTLNRDNIGNSIYNYTGNRLDKVDGLTGNYSYDENGSVIYDGRNGTSIGYNYLSLPATVSKSGLSISYIYDASGRKLRKVSSTMGTTDYVDRIHYKTDGSIDFMETEVGLVRRNAGNYSYEYTLSDHLGNARYSFDVYNGGVRKVQQQDYYPFGKVKESGQYVFGEKNKYLYNGKELQEELGQLDYGARFYDPVIGRWNVIDPKAEEMRRFSPYVYVFNNPMRFIDPDGMKGTDIWKFDTDTKELTMVKRTNDKFHTFVDQDSKTILKTNDTHAAITARIGEDAKGGNKKAALDFYENYGDLGNAIRKDGDAFDDMVGRAGEVGFGSKEVKDLKTAGERNVINGWINIARDELTGKYLPESAFSKAKDILDIPGTVKDLTGSTPGQIQNSGANKMNDLFKQVKEMMLNGAKKMQNGSL